MLDIKDGSKVHVLFVEDRSHEVPLLSYLSFLYFRVYTIADSVIYTYFLHEIYCRNLEQNIFSYCQFIIKMNI